MIITLDCHAFIIVTLHCHHFRNAVTVEAWQSRFERDNCHVGIRYVVCRYSRSTKLFYRQNISHWWSCRTKTNKEQKVCTCILVGVCMYVKYLMWCIFTHMYVVLPRCSHTHCSHDSPRTHQHNISQTILQLHWETRTTVIVDCEK